jgi:hypothetical protein
LLDLRVSLQSAFGIAGFKEEQVPEVLIGSKFVAILAG